MAETYDIGDVIRITSTFAQGAVSVDPTTVSLSIKVPAGTTTSYTYAGGQVTKDSTGHYHMDLEIAAAGTYRYRWTSTGTGEASEESWFEVRPRRVT